MPTVTFIADGNVINNAVSGIGFFGSTFGNSVSPGDFQQTTWMTNAAGTAQGPQVSNIKYLNQGSGYVESSLVATGLRYIPNQDATLNIRVTNPTTIQIQNAAIRIYDRTNSSNAASGVTTTVAELVHPGSDQTVLGSGGIVWTVFSGSVIGANTALSLSNTPGSGGNQGGRYGVTQTPASTWHDYYLAMSASPDSVGSKTNYGLYFSYEYM